MDMKLGRRYLVLCIWSILSLVHFSTGSNAIWAKEFTVVIDAGHGGRDPGAVGQTAKEKDINLKVALKLGNRIKSNCKDVKVVYTRERDVFVSLDRRAQIANNAKADLFISIHTNSVAKSKTVRGASTWTLGLAKSDDNLEVAKRENGVIMFESDYETRYAGFNPNSAESYIIFEFMQDKYMAQSVRLASLVQQQFKTTCKRVDKGVHQAGFLVLKATAMPSVLVELGFISTADEERYLNSEAGVVNMANGIYQAFLTYKNEQESHVTVVNSANTRKQPEVVETIQTRTEVKKESSPVFKVQILTSSVELKANAKQFKGLKDVECYREAGLYKYTYGSSTDYNKILNIRRKISSDFKDAFVVAFKEGKRVDINKAIQEFKTKNK